LTGDFLKWVIAANAIALPAAWIAMRFWLDNFAYRATISPWIFVQAALLALAVAFLTVSYQSIKAARANPVDCLRYE
jgi:putative ABC transport system permease protein